MKPALVVFWRRARWQAVTQLGWHGALGLVLALAAVAAAVVAHDFEAERERLLRRHVADLDARTRLGAAGPAAPDARDVAWRDLPPDRRRGATVVELLKLLEAARVEVSSAQYRLEDAPAGLRRLRVTLPVRGGYAGLRALVARVLNQMPNAALDGFELDRGEASSQVDGQLRLSLFFRREGA